MTDASMGTGKPEGSSAGHDPRGGSRRVAPAGAAARLPTRRPRASAQTYPWGSGWPHVTYALEDVPDAGRLSNAFGDRASDEASRRLTLVDDPAALYGFRHGS